MLKWDAPIVFDDDEEDIRYTEKGILPCRDLSKVLTEIKEPNMPSTWLVHF